MRETTAALAQVTDLMALVTAPAIDSATIHRVEVLLLQPNVVMVVVITSTGSVTKRVFGFEKTVDPGLVEWAASYLNESLAGMGVGLADDRPAGSPTPSSPPPRRASSPASPPPSPSSSATGARPSTSRAPRGCSRRAHFADLPRVDKLMTALEGRANVSRDAALGPRPAIACSSGSAPRTRSRSCARSAWSAPTTASGTATWARSAWSGPLRMDYATRDLLGARGRRGSSRTTSKTSTSAEHGPDAARLLRGPGGRTRRLRERR